MNFIVSVVTETMVIRKGKIDYTHVLPGSPWGGMPASLRIMYVIKSERGLVKNFLTALFFM